MKHGVVLSSRRLKDHRSQDGKDTQAYAFGIPHNDVAANVKFAQRVNRPERVSTAPANDSCGKHRCRTCHSFMMLSSLGFDKGVARTARNGSKYVLEVPRGFSVHVFKNPSSTPSGFPTTGKPDYPQNRDTTGSNWIKPPNYPSRTEPERKPLGNVVEPPRTTQLSAYARVFEPKRSKPQRPYGIYPTTIPDTYIYERSVSSASDILSSDSSSTSSDSDLNSESMVEFALEVSSTRASSSTETLETTVLGVQSNFTSGAAASGPIRSSSSPTAAIQPVAGGRLTRSSSQGPSPSSHPSNPPRHATVEETFDSDSETVISEGAEYSTTQTQAPITSTGVPRGLGTSLPLSTPIRRGSDEGSANSNRVGPQNPPSRTVSSNPQYDESILRAPPGLQTSSSTRPSSSRTLSNSSKPQTSPTEPARSGPGVDGACMLAATKRCVRWTENLICPSLVPHSDRRKGWFNRRGDQLWTNDGKFKSPDAGQEYPADLVGYPEVNAGWMNEDGVRIDMHHRLIPKPPLRSALKRPKTSSTQSNEYIQISNASNASPSNL